MAEIPSEFIEPYLKEFLLLQFEYLHDGFYNTDEVRSNLQAMKRFTSMFCGIHANLAIDNEYNDYIEATDEQLVEYSEIWIKTITN